MGLLDQFIGGGQQGRSSGMGTVIASGAALALLAHAMHQRQSGAQPQGGVGGGLLGSLLGSQGGLGGGQNAGQNIISGLGGAGAIQALLDRFTERGYGSQVASWLGDGPNQPIQPNEVENALGDNAVSQLEQQTGVPRQSLLGELASALPKVVDRLSPNGQVDDNSLRQLADSSTPRPH